MPIQAKWIKEYKEHAALWLHDGNARRPHALLTSGRHSDGFFNSSLVTQDPRLLEAACGELLDLAQEHGVNCWFAERVVSPAMGAITLGYELARQVTHRRGHVCRCSFAEKTGEGASATFAFKRVTVSRDELVLAAEDVITSGGSTEKVFDAALAAGGRPVGCVVALVNRSGLTNVRGLPIIALINRKMDDWAPSECPLCARGSEAIRPKDAENWKRLNAEYAAA